MNKILQVKPIVFFLIFISFMISSFYLGLITFASNSTSLKLLNSILSLFFISFIVLWFHTLGNNLYLLIKESSNLKINFFRMNLIYPFCYFLLGQTLNIIYNTSFAVSKILPSLIFFILHIYAIFSIIYCIRFIAKALVSVEINSNPTFSLYWKEFFSILFLVISIWWIQPRIQKIFKDIDNS